MGDDGIEILATFVGGIVLELDVEGRYLRVLSGESILLARPANELLGRTVRDVLGPVIAAPFEEMFRRVLATGAVETYDYVLDVTAGRRSFSSEARRRTAEGAPATVLLLVRDVTEQKELQAKLIAAERLAAVGMIAASVAHEIRQPLAFATTSVEVVARELSAAPNERAEEALAHVRDAVNRISEIAASVGMVARNGHSTRTTTTVLAPVDAALDLCASETRDRARMRVDVPPDVRVRAPEGELCQVLSNVILNAAQAMNAASASTNEIHISTSRQDDVVSIVVRDTGSGIAPDTLGRIFDPFFTTKDEGRGSGLGLYLSRRIAERWGGRISIASQVGVGSTVTIELPADDSGSSPRPPPVQEQHRMNILLVDDEAIFLRSLVLVLGDKHEVTTSSRAKEAIALLRADPKRFDAVVCDLAMPEIDGVGFYEEMRALGVADRFVVMSGGAFSARATSFLANVHCARIEKPFTPDELDRVLASVVPNA